MLQELGDDMRLLRDHCHQLSITLASLQDNLKRNRAVANAPEMSETELAGLVREQALTH